MEDILVKVDRNGTKHYQSKKCRKCGGKGYLFGYEHIDGAFGLEWYRGGDLRAFNAFTSICNVEYEVIGNIHDDPELLEVKK